MASEQDKYFNSGFTKQLLSPLKAESFKKYKTINIGRIVGDSIFQFLNVQKRTQGIKKFTVNVGIRALYLPSEYLSLAPGGRIYQFITPRGNRWWSYETEIHAAQSFSEIFQAVDQYVMPWFRDLSSTTGILREHENNKYQIEWSNNSWKTLDLGILYMREGNLEKSSELLTITREKTVGSDHPVDVKILGLCQTAIHALEGGASTIERYLAETEQQTRQALGLEKW